jgi:hypothetical protein
MVSLPGAIDIKLKMDQVEKLTIVNIELNEEQQAWMIQRKTIGHDAAMDCALSAACSATSRCPHGKSNLDGLFLITVPPPEPSTKPYHTTRIHTHTTSSEKGGRKVCETIVGGWQGGSSETGYLSGKR